MQYQVNRRSTMKRSPTGLLAVVIVSVATFVPALAHAQTFQTLYTFPGGQDGQYPWSLIFTPNGTLIGTATDSVCQCSIIFSLSPEEKETVLLQFEHNPELEGATPEGYVLSSNANVLYGDASYGGNYEGACQYFGCGEVFGVDLGTGKGRLLHQFTQSPDGAYPGANLAIDPAGNIYGLTSSGGIDYNGTVFEMSPAGAEKILYSFGNAPDGIDPSWGPIRNSAGNLFGVTINGGDGPCNDGTPGCGTVFEVTPEGKETILYNFQAGADGEYPWYVTADSSGNLYGISRTEASPSITKAIWEVDESGVFSIAYDGSFAKEITWFILGPSGTFYGIANGGDPSCGSSGCGRIFKLTPTGGGNGTVEILHTFHVTDGSDPISLLWRDGALYGSTGTGGSTNDGIIFKLVP